MECDENMINYELNIEFCVYIIFNMFYVILRKKIVKFCKMSVMSDKVKY